MRAASSGCLVVIVTLSACGGGSGNGEQEQISQSFDSLYGAVEDGDSAAVCAGLGPKARRQVRWIGHPVQFECAPAVRPLLAGLAKARRAGGSPAAPMVGDVEIEMRAVATVQLEGRSVKVPFVKGDDGWKLDSFYGLSPKQSKAIP